MRRATLCHRASWGRQFPIYPEKRTERRLEPRTPVTIATIPSDPPQDLVHEIGERERLLAGYREVPLDLRSLSTPDYELGNGWEYLLQLLGVLI